MPRRILFALLAGIIALSIINYSIYDKEKLLGEGEVVFLELAPVDPRSLMQGDYMALRFAIAEEIRKALLARQNESDHETPKKLMPQNGRIVVRLDSDRIASFQRLDNGSTAGDERILQYRLRNGRVKFATNAFFFQEGTAQEYENAEYGEFRVDREGELLLTGLRDKELRRLGKAAKH